jgi:FAD/FMN-containing dehydrogenase
VLTFPSPAPEESRWRRRPPSRSPISTNSGGVVIDLGALNTVERLHDQHVRIGPGARSSGVARALYPMGLAISSGDSGDVGVGGLATTRGIGLMGRAHGLTIDHLTAAEVVTADGRIVRASRSDHPDLFWPLRGAGANFGIVTSFEFRATPTPSVVQATVAYAITDVAGSPAASGGGAPAVGAAVAGRGAAGVPGQVHAQVDRRAEPALRRHLVDRQLSRLQQFAGS